MAQWTKNIWKVNCYISGVRYSDGYRNVLVRYSNGYCIIFFKVLCRCGAMDKEIDCIELSTRADDALCEKKCSKKRNCGKHKCGLKCCIDPNHICTLVCGKTLSCGQHRYYHHQNPLRVHKTKNPPLTLKTPPKIHSKSGIFDPTVVQCTVRIVD